MNGTAAVPKRREQPGGSDRPQRKLAGVINDQEVIAGFSRVKVAMVLSDPRAEDNPIVYVNAAFEKTTGYDRSAVVGRNCRFLQGEMTDKRDVDRIRTALEAGEDVSVDITNYRADGKPFLNRLTIAPIFDADGEVLYHLGIQKELYASEREESEADAMLVNMRARVQDDLSLVLAGIGEIEGQGDPHAFEAVARRLECLQLAYESIKLADDTKTGVRGIDLGALISRVAAAIAHEEGRAGLRYVQNIEPLAVNLDAAVRSALLLSEVLSNAFHHAFDRLDEGFVELRLTRLASGGLRMVVTDDGVGLPNNAPFPDPDKIGGRLINTLVDGLDATITPVRGAGGTVVMIDIPTGITDV
ncbi:PAS domain-containing protein [Jannaschia pohangensis]|uniref:PAS domain S-box-containing protein n=1 Tax=Jannaschia pohangensis TaxID=390807 RepID=A0A1I3LT01_9RHOB|nr:PAS domain-containing protein [Jannaschia pohangensis]SFI87861.1 PAS domain S-box-containing protein [Jannaschia pohangensis]